MASQAVCRNFLQGNCTYGERCHFRHVEEGANNDKNPCHAFQKGNCTFGDRCKYSHEVNGRSNTRETNGSTLALIGTSTAVDYDAFVRWRYDIPRTPADIKKAKPLHHRFARFIQTALDLVEAGAETMQEVIACLASPAGVARLSELLDANMSQMDDGSLLEFWKERLLPYLQLLAHENVLTSGIIEVQHATLLTYTYSINGKRAQAVFQSAVRCLTMDDEIPASIEPTLVVLAAMFEAVPTAQVNDALRRTAETLIALATDRKLSGFPHTQHTRLCLRLGLGGLIQQADPKKRNAKTAVKPTFVVTVDQPGELSTLGQRHDNDSEDIDDIQILPTMDEISSDRSEYLPQDDPASWHKLGVDGLLDRHFRLLREDTVGQLRDAAKFELQRLQNPHTRQSKPRNGARTHSYHNVRLAMVEFDSHKGLLCVLAFEQPHEVRNKSMKQRQDWWNECKRLENETLLGLLGSDGLVIFVTVVAAVAQRSGGKDQPEAQRPLEERYTKWCEQEAHVIVQLVNQDESNIESMLIGFGQHSGSRSGESSEHRFSLIEFPGIILPAFQPTLQGLQRMSRSGFLPFSNLLAPGADTPGHENEPPAYARRVGFRYDLSVLSENDKSIELDPHEPISAAELCQQTRLDHGQAQALITSLTCGLALIQGPPGTGKSYTGVALTKVLLANREAAKLGPIVIVTFSNHALDQNLEHLVTAGVKQIIRIGSRSKSELLGPINLRIVAQGYEATKPEKREKWEALKDMRRLTTVVTTSLRQLWHSRSMQGVEAYLKSHYFKQYQQLCEDLVDDEGFTKVTYRPKGVHEWLNGHARGPQLADDLSTWTQAKRHEGFATWLSASSSESERDVMVNLQAYDIARAAYNRNNGEIDLRALNDAHVIGVTTSGLARNLHVLSRLKAKVLIVEEAGEVLEAHLLTAMLPSIEHAILIGDHQQLRPKVANYEFSCENRGSNIKLDISLFERLIQPQQAGATPLPYAKLDVQRRMHPSISRLIRTTLYPELKDDASVEKYPQVCAPEEGQQVHTGAPDLFAPPATNGPQATTVAAADSTSHTNQYEVDMVFALVRHFIRQGVYRPSDIAVLTPYLGQLRRLRRSLSSFTEIVLNGRDVDELNKDGEHDDDQIKATEEVQLRMPVLKSTLLKAIRLGTVDNFQGEEAKVVIISLVRSNDLRKCGFLRTPNRINVLLSRAQHGMYVIGNPETASGVNMWQDVIQMLQKDGNMGPSFELSCARHPDTVLTATTPDDFTIVAPEAGCNLMCGKQLPCGHTCIGKCHSDGMHNAAYCTKPCTKSKKGCEHVCPYECGRQCDEKCNTMVTDVDVELPCGHIVHQLPCHLYQDQDSIVCRVKVKRNVPGCGHTVTVPCYVNIDSSAYVCPATCDEALPCGHKCASECCNCRPKINGKLANANHGVCMSPCGAAYKTCAHKCETECHPDTDCQPCQSVCDIRCSHGRCSKLCSEPCVPCAEAVCASRCPHSACSMPCAAPCDWIPCSLRCDRILACGHQCPSICGATCPPETYCQHCATDEVKGMRADFYEMTEYGDVDLATTPCIFTPCGHVYTVDSLDGVMRMAQHYSLEPLTGMPTELASNSQPFSSLEMKNCPDCRGSLRSMARYGRIIRRALLDESTKRFMVWSARTFHELSAVLQDVQAKLLETRAASTLGDGNVLLMSNGNGRFQRLKSIGSTRRYRDPAELRRQGHEFWRKAKTDEQPFARVYDMVETVRRQRKLNQDFVNTCSFDDTVLQTRGELLASALVIRCDMIAMIDLITVWDNDHKTKLEVNFSADRRDCEQLVARANATKNIAQETEGHVFWATFAALECQVFEANGAPADTVQRLRDAADVHIGAATDLCDTFPGQTSRIKGEVDDAKRMLHEAGYKSQLKMVVAAMGNEFRGTGHWYICVNGHPFVIGECGMAMELARCPDCNEQVGGTDHVAVAGVQHADQLEGDMARLRV